MDNEEYILKTLEKWVPLFYGKNAVPKSYYDPITEKYCFGTYDKMNSLTKPVALFLVLGHTPFLDFLKREGFNTSTENKPCRQKRVRKR